MTDLCRCARPLLYRHGDLEPTCGECHSSASHCECEPLHGDTPVILSQPVSLIGAVSDLQEDASGDTGDSGDTRYRPRTSWTAAELMAIDFPEPRWAVPGIIAEGVTVLAGAPRVGKSWLALGLGVAIASGGKMLGAIDVEQGHALYLALEDTGRRLKTRLAKVLGSDPAPDALTVANPVPAAAIRRGGHDLRVDRPARRHPESGR